MSFKFDPLEGLIIVKCELKGTRGTAIIRLALDTGATRTLINAGILTALGYDPGASKQRYEVTTGSGVEYSPIVIIKNIITLGETRKNYSVLSHTLPPSAGVDGLLGLDFFRGSKLKIDFQNGKIEVLR